MSDYTIMAYFFLADATNPPVQLLGAEGRHFVQEALQVLGREKGIPELHGHRSQGPESIHSHLPEAADVNVGRQRQP